MTKRLELRQDLTGLMPDERLLPAATRTDDAGPEVSQDVPSEPAVDIPPWERPGLDNAVRARLRGPFAYWLQKGNTRISVANPAWSPTPGPDSVRLADLLADGWDYCR